MVWRYELQGWKRERPDRETAAGLLMRPGRATVFLRLRITTWAILLIVTIGFLGGRISRSLRRDHPEPLATTTTPGAPVNQELQQELAALEKDLSPAARLRIERNEAARRQRQTALKSQARLEADAVWWLAAAAIAALAVLAIAAPLSSMWNRLVVDRCEPGVLQLVETGLWNRRRRIPIGPDTAMALTQIETRSSGGGYHTWFPGTRSRAWVLVLLPHRHEPKTRVEFWLRSIPGSAADFPPPEDELVEFVRPLAALIGVTLPGNGERHPGHAARR
jgi:hypothetical protein